MKRLETVTAVNIAVLASGCWASAMAGTFNRPKDVQQLTALETYQAGLTDVDKALEHFAPDALVADLMTPGWYQGRPAIYAAFKPQFESLKTLKFHIKDMNVATDGKFACVALQAQFVGTLTSGSALSTTFRELDAFKKIDGQWTWIQQHVSYPLDPKTGRSVTDGPLPVRGALKWSNFPLSGSAPPSTQAIGEIRNWLEAAVNVTDVDAMVKSFGPGDDVIVYDAFVPGEHRGVKELREYYAPVLSGIRDMQVSIPAFFADSDGVLGVLISQQDLAINMKDGTTQTMSIRQSDCLRRDNGKWQAFFEMVSVPMDPKTGMAVMGHQDLPRKRQ